MKIGYIQEYDLKLNPHLTKKFKFREELFTRHISSHGDKIRSKMLYGSVDYDEVKTNADIMKKNPKIILIREPFLLDDELRKKVVEWVEWANKADPSEYNPFAKKGNG